MTVVFISVSEAVLCRFDGNGIFVRLVVSFLINLENCFIQKFDVRSCDEQKSKQKTKTDRDLSLSLCGCRAVDGLFPPSSS